MQSSSKSQKEEVQRKVPDQVQYPKLNSGLQVSKRQIDLFSIIAEVNHLVEYKFTKEELMEWTKDIVRLSPQTDESQLRFVIDCFKTEKLEWNKGDGIQNFFRAFRRIHHDGHGWAVLRFW